MLTDDQRTAIANAVLAGMAKEDAYVLAGLTPSQVAYMEGSEEEQIQLSKWRAQLEYSLLDDLRRVIDRQVRMGREGAVTWLLPKVNPRYGTNTAAGGTITLNVANASKADVDIE